MGAGHERAFHDEAVGDLQAEYSRLQNRIDAMYVDKLDGKIDAGFFDRKHAEWRMDQERIQRSIDEHQHANESYMEQGIQLLELAQEAAGMFRKRSPQEKRTLLNFVCSNSTWKQNELKVEWRQPFDLIAETNAAQKEKEAVQLSPDGLRQSWLPNCSSGLQVESSFSIDRDFARKPRVIRPLVRPRVCLAVARAREMQRQLDTGVVNRRSDLAHYYGIDRPRVTQLLDLLRLHPALIAYIEQLPAGSVLRPTTERQLRGVAALEPPQQLAWASARVAGFQEFLAKARDRRTADEPFTR
jgi:hypothetical protein